jgi:hypothetical protein
VLFDPAVVRRLGAELLERGAEAFSRLLTATAATVNEADVGDDLALGLRVVELSKERQRASEVCERRVVVPAAGHGERKAVERQRLSSPVAELADDLERLVVVIDGRANISAPTLGCPSGVQPNSLPPAPGNASAGPRPNSNELPESGARAARDMRKAGSRDLWPCSPETRQHDGPTDKH